MFWSFMYVLSYPKMLHWEETSLVFWGLMPTYITHRHKGQKIEAKLGYG